MKEQPKTGIERNRDFRAKATSVPWRECANMDLRLELEADPPRWLKTFFPRRFNLPWSSYHLDIIYDSLYAIKHGTNQHNIAPRGGGKSRPIMGVVQYSVMTRISPFPVYVPWKGESVDAAFRFWSAGLANNKLLADMYPEICDPFRFAKGIPQRLIAIKWDGGERSGENTGARLAVSDGLIILPDSLGIIGSTTINGNPLGMAYDAPDGSTIRPTIVFVDDPQDDETAASPKMVEKVVKKINADFGGMGGPDSTLTMIMASTVKGTDCVSMHYKKDPEWNTKHTKRVIKWPSGFNPADTDTHGLWAEWNEVRREGSANKDGGAADREFYLLHKDDMIRGMEVSWDHRFDSKKGQPDAYYSAMVDFYRMGWSAFATEQQGEPIADRPEADYDLRAEHITKRTNGLSRGLLPDDAVACVAAVDINKDGLSVIVLAGTSSPSWSVIDYFKWLPAGRKAIWEGGDKASVEKAVAAAVEGCTLDLLAKVYGDRLDAIAFDAGSDWARVVHDTCKALRRAMPTRKIYSAKGASGFQYDPPRDRKGILRQGHLCDLRRQKYGTTHDMLMYWDSSYWHMTTQQGWLAPLGGMASVTVYGSQTDRHPKLAEECAADRLECVEHKGDKRQAKFKNTGPNHWGDALAMAAALLSTFGLIPAGYGKLKDKALYRPAEATRTPVTPIAPTPAQPAAQSQGESVLLRRKPVAFKRGGFASRLW